MYNGQDNNWHNINKDNFKNSTVGIAPTGTLNFVPLNPDNLINYGTYSKETFTSFINSTISINLHIATIKSGMNLYHGSMSLPLSHSDFPIQDYEPGETRDTVELRNCPIFQPSPNKKKLFTKYVTDLEENKICTNTNFYSNLDDAKLYGKSKGGYRSIDSEYTFGIKEKSIPDKPELIQDRIVSDTSIIAYKLYKDAKFVLFATNFLTNNISLGLENMLQFRMLLDNEDYMQTALFLEKEDIDMVKLSFLISLGIDSISMKESTYMNQLTAIDTVYKIKNAMSDYILPLLTYVINNKNRFPNGYITEYEKHVSSEADIINFLNNDKYTSTRFSYIATDLIVVNFISEVMRDLAVNRNIAGLLSEEVKLPDMSTFHEEIIFFFAPEHMSRNRDNEYDYDYKINKLGIIQELRKFKTTNIRYTNNGFHAGHLYEHSVWAALNADSLIEKDIYIKGILSSDSIKKACIVAAFLHDIGKAGECDSLIEVGHANYDIDRPYETLLCEVIRDNKDNDVGFIYYEIPNHPYIGYKYLKGYIEFKKFVFGDVKKSKKIRGTDWDTFFSTTMGFSNYESGLIKIAVAMHWDFGLILKEAEPLNRDQIKLFLTIIKKMEGKDEEESKNIAKNNFKDDKFKMVYKRILEYCRKLEMFINSHFSDFALALKFSIQIITFCIVVSVADIYASEFDAKLKKWDRFNNVLPNYHWDNKTSIPVYKSKILTNVRSKYKHFAQAIPIVFKYALKKISNNKFDNLEIFTNLDTPFDYNLVGINVVPIEEKEKLLYIAYTYLPKVIIFELECVFTKKKVIEFEQTYAGGFEILNILKECRKLGIFVIISTLIRKDTIFANNDKLNMLDNNFNIFITPDFITKVEGSKFFNTPKTKTEMMKYIFTDTELKDVNPKDFLMFTCNQEYDEIDHPIQSHILQAPPANDKFLNELLFYEALKIYMYRRYIYS